MDIKLTDSLIQSILPHSVVTVEGESSLAERIEPYLPDSLRWLQSLITGDTVLSDEHTLLATRAAVMRAVINAIPALDLVVTPSGFAVTRSNNMSPASKERIERLISQLSSNLDELLMQLQEVCMSYPQWRQSSPGKWYCSTFLNSLRDAVPLKTNKDLYTTYSAARGLAIRFENALAEMYLGFDLMDTLRSGYADGTYDASHTIISLIRLAVSRYVSKHFKEDPYRCPDILELWHAARAILSNLPRFPELDSIYELERQTHLYQPKQQPGKRSGGFFF